MTKIDALIDWYSNLTPQSLNEVSDVYHEQARFRDPFNDVRGHSGIADIFRHMYDTTEKSRFEITRVSKTIEPP